MELQGPFDAWFAGSKVVDAEGRPLVVYHGTTSAITEFDDREVVAGFHFGTPAQAGMRVAGYRIAPQCSIRSGLAA